jgi:hypothetical protein
MSAKHLKGAVRANLIDTEQAGRSSGRGFFFRTRHPMLGVVSEYANVQVGVDV